MLFLNGHGRGVLAEKVSARDINEGYIPVECACGFQSHQYYPAWDAADFGKFGYLFPDEAEANSDPSITEALDTIASEMIDQAGPEDANSHVAAIFTYLGQFIDHDITAGTDRERSVSEIDVSVVQPLSRDTAALKIANLRTGKLDLDSLYGGATVQGRFAEEFSFGKILRHPTLTAKLWIGTDTLVRVGGTVENHAPPNDPAGDILRLGRVMDAGLITEQQIRDLPTALRASFLVKGTNQINRRKAVIGDSRNDENLAVAQVHLAMARLHNVTVDHAPSIGGPNGDTSDESYEFARRQTRWQYQWLVINDYLPAICDQSVLTDVLAQNAPVYRDFFGRVAGASSERLPMPFEFSVAAFRFGHTMARPTYDWNGFFGKDGVRQPHATFRQLFQFTGNGGMAGLPFPTLPSNWLADWARLTDASGKHPMRTARKFDTHLAPDLADMVNEGAGMHARMKHLAERNLRRGHRLNLPSGQACLAGYAAHGIHLPVLSSDDLRSGPGGDILQQSSLIDQVPLWYYILREAEVMANGEHLGPLGSRIVAETLIGLVRCDPESYWNEPGAGPDGEWHPVNNVQPSGEVIDTFAKAFRAAGVL